METMLLAAVNAEVSYKEIPEFQPTGAFSYIKAITYDGAEMDGQKTKVFAYVGFPQNVTEGKVPAVVLIHGGGGYPYLMWIKKWNDLGYAAIAMSTTGYFPNTVNAGFTESGFPDAKWNYGLHGIFAEDGYINAPDNDHMRNSEAPFQSQWMYHAVTQVIHAGNILRAEPQVDPDKIGIIGISWGSVIASLVIGYDTRYAFAVPIYGSGYLPEALTLFADYFGTGKNPEMWLAESRFENVSMPVLWLCSNTDNSFSVNSNNQSYIDTVKNNADTRLAMINDWSHSHVSGWGRNEAYLFAEAVLGNEKRSATVVIRDGMPVIDNPDNVEIVSINIVYLTESLHYVDGAIAGNWTTVPQTYADGELTVTVPEGAKLYYFEVCSQINEKTVIATSALIEA